MYEEEEVIARCLNAGAAGYVLKDAPRAHLIHAIDVAHKGGQYLSSRALQKVVTQYLKESKSAVTGYDRLTDREREVLQFLADGLTLKDVAAQLALSVKTVDAHKTNLMRKLDLHDRVGLIKYAIEQKVIRIPSLLSRHKLYLDSDAPDSVDKTRPTATTFRKPPADSRGECSGE
jgi:two-component system response regulator NreC